MIFEVFNFLGFLAEFEINIYICRRKTGDEYGGNLEEAALFQHAG